MRSNYIGRFAPSPTGPLHIGSLVAAMASYLDARIRDGRWLVRIEDVDEARAVPGAAKNILQSLLSFGMLWNDEVVHQSDRYEHYESAIERLGNLVYPCSCTRREIADSGFGAASDGGVIYSGTCREGLAPGKPTRALRLRVPNKHTPNDSIFFQDRWMGDRTQQLSTDVGDFVLKRADGFWAYQLAVVIDDADQGITHVVRGADLLESTPRQIYLQRLLQLPTPRYLHVPVVTNAFGEKLSKQTGAQALDLSNPLAELHRAAQFLGLQLAATNSIAEFWQQATNVWAQRFL